MICSNCFFNYGLKYTAEQFGIRNNSICRNCFAADGFKISDENIKDILESFFVEGTTSRQYLVPLFRVIEIENLENFIDHYDYELTEDVLHDLKLIGKHFKKCVFNHLLNTDNFAEEEIRHSLLKNLNKSSREKNQLNKKLRAILDTLINCCNKHCIKKGELLFRIRKNPLSVHDWKEYDSPETDKIKNVSGRFNNGQFPVFYCSNNPETCLYESKFDPTDEIILATYKVQKDLIIIDLENTNEIYMASLNEELSEIYNERYVLHFLSAITRSRVDNIYLRLLSARIYENKCSGIKFKSFYDRYRKELFSNISLFDYPLKSGLLELRSLNRVFVSGLNIDWTFGPSLG